MEIIRFGRTDAKKILAFGSRRSASVPLASGSGNAHAYCIYFRPGGMIGPHVAGFDQLFLVVSGRGWVSGRDGKRFALRAGQGAIFRRCEMHSKGSRTGMTAMMFQVTRLRRRARRVR